MSNFVVQVQTALQAAQEVADQLGPDLYDMLLRTAILSSTIQLQTLIADSSENPECGPINLPGQPAACWSDVCIEWSRADSTWLDRIRYGQACTDWEGEIRNQLAELANLLEQAGAISQSEVVYSLIDQTVTMGEQAELVTPDLSTVAGETPAWLKLGGLGLVVLLIARVLK